MTFLTYWHNLALEIDRVFSIKAKEALEHAYEAFTAVYPSKRYKWLATSRLILRFMKLKEQLRTTPYQDACRTVEDFWKRQFYTAIVNLRRPLTSVFNISSGTTVDNQIEPRSELVVLWFCKMEADAIDEVDAIELYSGLKGKWGLQVDEFFEQKLNLQDQPSLILLGSEIRESCQRATLLMSLSLPHNIQIQKTGAGAVNIMPSVLPASDLER